MKTATAGRRAGGKMELITAEILAKAPRLYANENKAPEEVPVVAKFFNPVGPGTWYMTEYDSENELAFGLCVIHEAELGYFSIRELEEVDLPFGMSIERDLYWKGTLADAQRIEHAIR